MGILGYKILHRFLEQESKAKIVVTIMSLIVGLPIIFIYFSIFLF